MMSNEWLCDGCGVRYVNLPDGSTRRVDEPRADALAAVRAILAKWDGVDLRDPDSAAATLLAIEAALATTSATSAAPGKTEP